MRKGNKMQDNLNLCLTESTLTASLSGELDHHTVGELRERIDGELFAKRPRVLVMDFSHVSFMDSSGIGLIIGRAEPARATRSTVRISGMSERLKRLVRLSGISRLDNVSVSD